MTLPIYYKFLQYRKAYGENVARRWLHFIIDFWYVEDKEVCRNNQSNTLHYGE